MAVHFWDCGNVDPFCSSSRAPNSSTTSLRHSVPKTNSGSRQLRAITEATSRSRFCNQLMYLATQRALYSMEHLLQCKCRVDLHSMGVNLTIAKDQSQSGNDTFFCTPLLSRSSYAVGQLGTTSAEVLITVCARSHFVTDMAQALQRKIRARQVAQHHGHHASMRQHHCSRRGKPAQRAHFFFRCRTSSQQRRRRLQT